MRSDPRRDTSALSSARTDGLRGSPDLTPASRVAGWGSALAALGLVLLASRGLAQSASAGAYGYQGTDTQIQLPTASAHVHRTGPDYPGYTDATGRARLGWLDGNTVMFGCAINAPFQQICNNGGNSADFSDVITISADAPNGTPVDIQATLELDGTIDGIGGYSYQANGVLYDQSRGFAGTTGGTVQTVQNLSIDDTRTWTRTLLVGGSYNISAHLQTAVFNRICAGGSNTCTPSITEWTMTFTSALTLRFQVLSPVGGVQLTGQGGHDYLTAPTAVAGGAPGPNRLLILSANPSRGRVVLALDLEAPSSVDVSVFDVAGRRLATIASGPQRAGTTPLTWDGRDLGGREVRGMCFVRARGDAFTAQRRVLIVR